MSVDQSSPLVPIKPQVSLQNSSFIKNSHNRSSFCGVTPSPTSNGSFKTFSVNRKSWCGNVSVQFSTPDCERAPPLGTFRSATGTFPRQRERNNNNLAGLLSPNGNTVHTFKGSELRRSGSAKGRRYAEIGNWTNRNATFLEPHLQGVGCRVSRSSESDERSTEDDERALLRSSPRLRLPPPPPPPDAAPAHYHHRLQAMRVRGDANKCETDGSAGDSLSQSRESLSSEEGARGDCSSVDTSGSEEQAPCGIGTLERLIRTHPVWYLPGIQRAGAFHLLQGKEEGNFVVRQSSQPDTMAISVRLPADKDPYIEHYLIQISDNKLGLETSHNRFDNMPQLIAHYSQCCDELPVQLQLPRPLREAKNRHQLSSLALLGQEFWRCPMASPKATSSSALSPCQLTNGVVPMAITPSDTGSSLSSFNASTGALPQQVVSPDRDQNVVLKMSPIEGSESPPSRSLSTFKGRQAPSPPTKPGSFVRAPRPTPPNTLNLISSTNSMHRMSPDGECINAMTASLHGSFKRHMTETLETGEGTTLPDTEVTGKPNVLSPSQMVSPNGSNSVTSGIFSPTSQINSPVSNDTISSKSGVFSPISQTNKSEIFSPMSRHSEKGVFSPTGNQSMLSPLAGKEREKVMSPNTNTTSSTPSGRSRRTKHSHKKESRHYQESDILESPGVYCRSSLMDKVSDYEDIWGPESNGCSTFKPSNTNNGIMKSKRPDLLPDTLPKLNAAKSTQSIIDKDQVQIMNSNDSIVDEKAKSTNSLLRKSLSDSNELIATTNSKGEVVPKRPDKLNIVNNMNKKLTEEIESSFKNKESFNIESMETVRIEDDSMNDLSEDFDRDNTGSSFYADPVDAIKEATQPVTRRKLLRTGMNLAQRYSEPPQGHPYYPLRDMHSIEELSPSSPTTSTSVDNLISPRSKPRMKPVQPPKISGKPPNGKPDPTWAVDYSWEFINKADCGDNSESGTFPSLVEQESRLSADDAERHLTVHHIVAQRLPELQLNSEPCSLQEEVRPPPRASCYDNVHDARPLSGQASDDGTVFSEPWDSSQWDGLLPPPCAPHDEDGCEWDSPLPRRAGSASRVKSFRDRLDPLLAAGRVRALCGSRTARGAGAALRAYALHLAQDKSTTFAQNIDNFIACTLDSKENCPQVVMRNMRQFMSGMKNYLVKHGEREFEKEVEKERLKLKPTEFLNLDAILEGVMHRLVVRPLRARLYSLLATWHARDVRRLHAAIECAHHATPLQLGVKESTKVPSSAVLAVISKHFLLMQEADSPLDKLENLLASISVIFNSIRGERSLGADDLLPVLAWTVARCRLVCAELEAELMAGLLPPALLAGEGGYYLTALFSAVAVLKRLAPDNSPDTGSPHRRGSVEGASEHGACAVVRVALPDECRGWIRRVALPCRPGARARDLCRALAHAAAITNPQDYALFALHDSQETMLNENDCPQEVMSEKNGQNFILAYKRIDAKIAWPQQALLSLP